MSFINKIIKLLSTDHLSSGLEYYDNNEYKSAIAEFTKVIVKYPDPSHKDHKLAKFYISESHIALADHHIKNGRTEEAKHHYQKVTEFNDYPDVFLKLSEIYYKDGDYGQAEKYANKSLDISENFYRAKLLLCAVLIKMERVQEASDYLIDLIMNTSIVESREELENIIQSINNNDTEQALRLLNSITIDRPKEWFLLIKQGDSYFYEGDYQSALDSYEKAIELKGGYPDYHLKKGKALLELKRYADAVVAFQKAIEINSDYIEARISLALTLVLCNNLEEAKRQFGFILKIDPENEEALLNLKELLKT